MEQLTLRLTSSLDDQGLSLHMKNLAQHHGLPLWYEVVKTVLTSCLAHKRVEVTVVVPTRYDWLQEFGATNTIPCRVRDCGDGLVEVCLSPETQGQGLAVIEAVVADEAWSYDGCVTILFVPPGMHDLGQQVRVTPIADGKGIKCTGASKEIGALRTMVSSVVRSLSPQVVLEEGIR